MKITMYTTDASCNELVEVKAAHITLFEKDWNIKIYFIDVEEEIKFIRACIKNYVNISCLGMDVTILTKEEGQRVRFRFD